MADVVGQLLITPIAYTAFCIINAPYGATDVGITLAGCYLFGVGAWQATSCLVWALATPASQQSTGRKVYSYFLTFITVTAIILRLTGGSRGIFNDVGILVLFAMLFIGPIMSVWYFTLTVREASAARSSQSIE